MEYDESPQPNCSIGDDQYILASVLGSLAFLILIVTILLSDQMLRYREFYPIKERSPLITVFQLMSFYASNVAILIQLLIKHESQFLQMCLELLASLGELFFFFLYLFKVLRIRAALKGFLLPESILTKSLLYNQKKLIMLALILSILTIASIDAILQATIDQQLHLEVTRYLNMVSFIMIELTLLYGLKLWVKYKDYFQMAQENIIIISYLFSLLSIVSILPFIKDQDTKCLIMNVLNLFLWIFYIGFGIISLYIPLRNKREYRIQEGQPEILNKFKTFIMNEQCFELFKKYLSERDFETPLNRSIVFKLFHYYLEARQQLVENLTFTHQFVETKKPQLQKDQELQQYIMSIDGFNIQESLQGDEFEKLESSKALVYFMFQQSFQVMKQLYYDYRTTVSFMTLNQRFIDNEFFEGNLNQMQMCSPLITNIFV